MKVRVSPPYDGAGSFEAEQVDTCLGFCRMKDGAQYPSSWCEKIPEITPEPGDICEFFDLGREKTIRYLKRITTGTYIYIDDCENSWKNCHVLARKLPDWEKAKDAVWRFWSDITDSSKDGERAAYERFLADILGVPYARGDHD